MSDISDQLERQGFFALATEKVVTPDEESNSWELLEWTSERVAASNLFRYVGLGDSDDNMKQHPHAIIVPGEAEPVEVTNRSDDVTYSIFIIIRTIGAKMIAVKRAMAVRDRIMRIMRRKPTIEPLRMIERGATLKDVHVKAAPIDYSRRADNEWETAVNVEFIINEPRHEEDKFEN